MRTNRLAIGTAQAGMPYGISNRAGVPSDSELSAILQLARNNGIDTIDTAAAYGNAEQRLGETDLSGFRVVSKFPKGGYPRIHAEESLRALHLEKLYGFLAHNVDDILQNRDAWESLSATKATGKTERIGFSLYSPQQLENCLSKGFVPDIVQFPYSLLDRRFEPCFDELKKVGCEIHTRSAFLQGLYFLDPGHIPVSIRELAAPLRELQELAKYYGLTTEELALAFVSDDTRIDRIVIGVENTQQLQSNIDAAKKTLPDELRQAILHVHVSHEDLLNPSKW